VTVRRADQHVGQSPCQCVIPEDVLIQLFPPDDERLSLETCRGRKINTLKKVKKVRQDVCKSRITTYVVMVNLFLLNVSQRTLLYYRNTYSLSCLRASKVYADLDTIVSFGRPIIKADKFLTIRKSIKYLRRPC
jgi:hypothetical protein